MYGYGLDRSRRKLLITEVAILKSKGKLTVTGKLGVMQECSSGYELRSF